MTSLADRVAGVVTAPASGDVYEVADRPDSDRRWQWACAVRRAGWATPTVLTGDSATPEAANLDAFHALRTLTGHPTTPKEPHP